MISDPVYVLPLLTDHDPLHDLALDHHSELNEVDSSCFFRDRLALDHQVIGDCVVSSVVKGLLQHFLDYLDLRTVTLDFFWALPIPFFGQGAKIVLNVSYSVPRQCRSIENLIKFPVFFNLRNQSVKFPLIFYQIYFIEHQSSHEVFILPVLFQSVDRLLNKVIKLFSTVDHQ
jgi:hypothetical protein